MKELNLVYEAEEKKSIFAKFLRDKQEHEKIYHNLLIYDEMVFSDLNGEARILEVIKNPIPRIRITELNKVPSGFLSRRIFEYYPLQAEEIDKLLHPLCFLQNPSELNVDRNIVLARDHVYDMNINVLNIAEIRIENNELVMHQRRKNYEVLYEFFLEEKDGFYIVKEFTRNGVKFRIV